MYSRFNPAMILVAVFSAALITACGDDAPAVAEDIFADLGEPLPSATPAQAGAFERGRAVALHRFTADEGLGPALNVTFCGACHEKPVFGGSAGRYRDFLLVGQILGDGSFSGTGINGVQNQYVLAEDIRGDTDERANVIANRNPIPFFGVGLLAEISDEEILRRADPDDEDGDGISGRANFDRGFVGRFGRKSQSVAIESFIRGPIFNHLGITTDPLPVARRVELPVPGADPDDLVSASAAPQVASGVGSIVLGQVGAPDEALTDTDSVADPELSEDELFDLVSFAMLMAAPRPDEPTEQTERGEKLFADVQCSACHVPALKGPRGAIPAYTDLLIHDMGPELADGVPQGDATGSEFRTAPLWGIVAVSPYLHDGRADTLEEAILFHGGEAQASREAYEALGPDQRADVLAFLESLGGKSQRSEGLVPPNAPIPDVGEYGGPIAALSASDAERFLRGRAVFDLDVAITGGLGPRFNGDSCRACHFDPVIGGSGPLDVNVVRHGIVDPGDGSFSPPSIGTMAHRHDLGPDSRPPIDAAANVFEARQTPPIFGLGLIDRIPEATILANEDPDDLDGDGISGRAHILPDTRLGRLGWKAGVPSVAEFARDAMFNELGMTLPDQSGLTFGGDQDSDGIADPEITVEALEDLAFYMSNLAAPPRTPFDPDREAIGETLFTDVGCASCHVPVMKTDDGVDVPLYSDLLLHDVAPALRLGIEDGDASMREFRTPPLWGLAQTGPYMHDGTAFTAEEAILAHDGEAHDSRDAYLALPPSMQEALLIFLESL